MTLTGLAKHLGSACESQKGRVFMTPEDHFLLWNILPNGNVAGQTERRHQAAGCWLPGSPCTDLSPWPGLLAARQP